MKKCFIAMMAVILVLGLTACGDEVKDISDKEYQSVISNMGISGIEDVADGATLAAVCSEKIDQKFFDANESANHPYYLIAQKCGEQKKTGYYGCYATGTDKEQASAVRDEYLEYLTSQGYEFLVEDTTYGDIYTKGAYAVLVGNVTGPVSWNDKVSGQYGVVIHFY